MLTIFMTIAIAFFLVWGVWDSCLYWDYSKYNVSAENGVGQ